MPRLILAITVLLSYVSVVQGQSNLPVEVSAMRAPQVQAEGDSPGPTYDTV